jgi:hypothetical protein
MSDNIDRQENKEHSKRLTEIVTKKKLLIDKLRRPMSERDRYAYKTMLKKYTDMYKLYRSLLFQKMI